MAVKLYIDAFPNDFFVAEGVLSGRWNGWVVPYFTKSQAHEVWEKMSRSDDWSGPGAYGYDEEKDEFFYESEGERSTYGRTRIRREIGDVDYSYDAYSLGGHEWCWTFDDGEVTVE